MKDWWLNLSAREKQGVSIGGAFLAIFLIYALLWSPLVNHVADLRQRIEREKKLLVFMQTADKQIQQIEKTTHQQTKSVSLVALLSILQKAINQRGLQQSLTQLKQGPNDTIEMHFQKVDFDKLMKLMLGIVRQYKMTISQMSAVAASVPGLVNADVVLSLQPMS